MSTRSVVAKQVGDGWAGKYVHCDGYPKGMIPVLRALVARDGLDEVLKNVVEDGNGWSFLRPEQVDISHIRVPHNATWRTYDYASPKQQALAFRDSYSDGRFINVPGYGVSYTSEQAGPDPWYDSETGADSDAAFAYILTKTGIRSYVNGGMAEGSVWEETGVFPFEPSADDDRRFDEAECGVGYSRCGHYAWAHFPEVDHNSRISTRYYLGTETELTFRDAMAVLLPSGKQARLQGSHGWCGADGAWDWSSHKPRNFMYVTLVKEDLTPGSLHGTKPGAHGTIRVGHKVVDGMSLDLPLVFPASLKRDEITLPAGSVIPG